MLGQILLNLVLNHLFSDLDILETLLNLLLQARLEVELVN